MASTHDGNQEIYHTIIGTDAEYDGSTARLQKTSASALLLLQLVLAAAAAAIPGAVTTRTASASIAASTSATEAAAAASPATTATTTTAAATTTTAAATTTPTTTTTARCKKKLQPRQPIYLLFVCTLGRDKNRSPVLLFYPPPPPFTSLGCLLQGLLLSPSSATHRLGAKSLRLQRTRSGKMSRSISPHVRRRSLRDVPRNREAATAPSPSDSCACIERYRPTTARGWHLLRTCVSARVQQQQHSAHGV